MATTSNPINRNQSRFDEIKSTLRAAKDELDVYIAIPPDGGYGWVIVGIAFMNLFILDGITQSFGNIKPSIFNATREEGLENFESKHTSIAYSTFLGCYYMIGPVMSAVLNRFGFQVTGIVGAVVAGTAFLLASFARSGIEFILFFGVMSPLEKIDEEKGHEWLGKLFACFPRKFKSSDPPIPPVERKKLIPRPVYRDDAFYEHSLALLPEYNNDQSTARSRNVEEGKEKIPLSISQIQAAQDKRPSFGYHMSVTRVASITDLSPPTAKTRLGTIWRTFILLFHFGLFKLHTFQLIAVAISLNIIGIFLPYLYLPERAQHNHVDIAEYKWFLSTMGISSLFGRISSGMICFCPCINATYLFALSSLACGLLCLTMAQIAPEPDNFHIQIVLCAAYGFFVGFYGTIRSVIFVINLGLENLTNAFGLFSLCMGVSATLGLPIASVIHEHTGSYQWSFVFAAALMLVSGTILMAVPTVRQWEARKFEKT